MAAGLWIRLDADGGAVWFQDGDQAELTSEICSALNANVAQSRTLVWVDRLDLRSGSLTFPLFHDEDGSSHLELVELSAADRDRVVRMLVDGGFHVQEP
jgi:hypothetical protein